MQSLYLYTRWWLFHPGWDGTAVGLHFMRLSRDEESPTSSARSLSHGVSVRHSMCGSRALWPCGRRRRTVLWPVGCGGWTLNIDILEIVSNIRPFLRTYRTKIYVPYRRLFAQNIPIRQISGPSKFRGLRLIHFWGCPKIEKLKSDWSGRFLSWEIIFFLNFPLFIFINYVTLLTLCVEHITQFGNCSR
jgi:hypothetical protein